VDFDPSNVYPVGALLVNNDVRFDENGNQGADFLRPMRERAEMLGGSLRIDSRHETGTRVELRVPLDWQR